MENTLLFPTGIVLYKPQIAMVRHDTLGQYPNVVWERDEDESIKTTLYKLAKIQMARSRTSSFKIMCLNIPILHLVNT